MARGSMRYRAHAHQERRRKAGAFSNDSGEPLAKVGGECMSVGADKGPYFSVATLKEP